MVSRDKQHIKAIKRSLLSALKAEHAFWSYDQQSIKEDNMPDDQLVTMTMRYLDLSEIKLLFDIFSFKKIKSAWQRILVPEGEYLYTLNRFFAWYYFKAKRPDAYLKSLETRHFNKLIGV